MFRNLLVAYFYLFKQNFFEALYHLFGEKLRIIYRCLAVQNLFMDLFHRFGE